MGNPNGLDSNPTRCYLMDCSIPTEIQNFFFSPKTPKFIQTSITYKQSRSLLGLPSYLFKIQHRLLLWENKYLNLAGRVTLIKSVLASLPTHIMQSIQLPHSTLSSINKHIRQFLWGSSFTKHKLHLVNWKIVTTPLSFNGLGIPNVKTRNSALLMILHHVYSKNPTKRSPIFKSIQLGWNLCKPELGSGTSVRFWLDSWCTLHPLCSLLSSPFTAEDKQLLVSDIYQNNTWQFHILSNSLHPTIIDKIHSLF